MCTKLWAGLRQRLLQILAILRWYTSVLSLHSLPSVGDSDQDSVGFAICHYVWDSAPVLTAEAHRARNYCARQLSLAVPHQIIGIADGTHSTMTGAWALR